MQVESCIEKIEKRNHRDNRRILYVNINNDKDLRAIKEHFEVGYSFVNVATKGKDEMPTLDETLDLIESFHDVVFIEGISAYSRLGGQKQLKTNINLLLNTQLSSKAVVLLYQCDDILQETINKDPRVENQILFVEGNKQELPKIIFVKEKVADILDSYVIKGLSTLIRNIETEGSAEIFVKTHFTKEDFPDSLYLIEEMSSFFEIVKKEFLPSLSLEDEGLLNEEQWRIFAEGCKKNNGIEGYFRKAIGDMH